MRFSARLLFALGVASCAPAGRAPPSSAAAAPPPAAPATRWTTTLGVSHPLVGKIWDPRARRFVERGAVFAAVAAADFAVLGEKHDNPDHHALQAECVRAVVATGARPAIAFEMIDADQQRALDGYVASGGDAARFGTAVDWEGRGWPSYATYAPIVAVALERRLSLAGANMPLADVRAIVKHGLEPEAARRLGLVALTPEQTGELREEMRGAHCGQLPERMLDPMATAQRARDATMAARMADLRARSSKVVLIAGDGHARTDRGVPAYLRARLPAARVVSVAFVEVQPDAREPESAPYDYVWYTPRASDEDPCKELGGH